MTCTLRNWEGCGSHRQSFSFRMPREPSELLLNDLENASEPCTIAVNDIAYAKNSSNNSILLKTNDSVYEIDKLNINGHGILWAFLNNSLPPKYVHNEIPLNPSTSSVHSCLDIDTLQARHLKDRAENETWPEKVSRRFGRVVANLSELSSTLCDSACGRNEHRDNPNNDYVDQLERRDAHHGSKGGYIHMPSGLSVELDSSTSRLV